MARIQGLPKSKAGPMVRLAYRFGPRMMRKLTGREASIGSGIQPMEIWAHKPRLMIAMGRFNGALRKPGAPQRAERHASASPRTSVKRPVRPARASSSILVGSLTV